MLWVGPFELRHYLDCVGGPSPLPSTASGIYENQPRLRVHHALSAAGFLEPQVDWPVARSLLSGLAAT